MAASRQVCCWASFWLLLFLLLSFISIAIWAAINSNTTGQRRMMLIISAYLMIWLAFGNLYYFFSDTENFVATNTTSVEGLVKEWDGDMHVNETAGKYSFA